MLRRVFGTAFSGMHLLPAAIVAALVATACSEEKTEVIHKDIDGDRVPTMTTYNVTTLISDSGITKYRITAPMWYVFDEAKDPQWRFPNGLLLEKFDGKFLTEATIECDSATYFKDKGLWRLDGDVNILNTLNEKFLTQQVFWNQRDRKVYSDSFVHIEKSDRIIEGYGFVSNERMTNYSINRPSGIFPVSDFTGKKGDSTAVADSVVPAPAKATAVQPASARPAKDADKIKEPVGSGDAGLQVGGKKKLMRVERLQQNNKLIKDTTTLIRR